MTKKMSFNYDDSSYEDSKRKRTKKSSSDNFLKLGKLNKIAILPGLVSDDGKRKDWVSQTLNHEVWIAGKKLGSVGCNKAFDEDCPICERGWKVYSKYKNSNNEAKKKIFKMYMPRDDRFVNAVKINSTEDEGVSVKVFRVPKTVHEEIEEHMMDNNLSPSKMFHPDKGKTILIKSNGEKGIMVRYKPKVTDAPVKLLTDGIFEDEESLIGQMVDLDKFQLEYDDSAAKALIKKLDSMDKGSSDDEDEEEEDSDDDVEMDEDEDSDDDMDDEDDEPAPKKKASPSKKKVEEEEEDDLDDDLDDEDDLDDDLDDEDDEPAPKKAASSKSKASKFEDDDLDDEDDLDDDLEDDEEEEPAPKKKVSKK